MFPVILALCFVLKIFRCSEHYAPKIKKFYSLDTCQKNVMIGFKGLFVAAVSIRMFLHLFCFRTQNLIYILVKSSYRDMSKKLGEKFKNNVKSQRC